MLEKNLSVFLANSTAGLLYSDHAVFLADNKFAEKKKSHLKVSSVVSKYTLDEMEKVGHCLRECPPEVWKLRQFTIRGDGSKDSVRTRYDVSTLIFQMLYSQLKSQFPEIYITCSEKDDYTGALIIITPKGEVILPYGKENVFVGHLIRDNLQLRYICTHQFPEEKKKMHMANYDKSYVVPINRKR